MTEDKTRIDPKTMFCWTRPIIIIISAVKLISGGNAIIERVPISNKRPSFEGFLIPLIFSILRVLKILYKILL